MLTIQYIQAGPALIDATNNPYNVEVLVVCGIDTQNSTYDRLCAASRVYPHVICVPACGYALTADYHTNLPANVHVLQHRTYDIVDNNSEYTYTFYGTSTLFNDSIEWLYNTVGDVLHPIRRIVVSSAAPLQFEADHEVPPLPGAQHDLTSVIRNLSLDGHPIDMWFCIGGTHGSRRVDTTGIHSVVDRTIDSGPLVV